MVNFFPYYFQIEKWWGGGGGGGGILPVENERQKLAYGWTSLFHFFFFLNLETTFNMFRQKMSVKFSQTNFM